jgi:hypothetical protein
MLENLNTMIEEEVRIYTSSMQPTNFHLPLTLGIRPWPPRDAEYASRPETNLTLMIQHQTPLDDFQGPSSLVFK